MTPEKFQEEIDNLYIHQGWGAVRNRVYEKIKELEEALAKEAKDEKIV